MLISKTVKTKASGRMLNYYKNLGYNCAYNGEVEVLIEHLKSHSRAKVEVKCEGGCEGNFWIKYYSYTQSIKKNNPIDYLCHKCMLLIRNSGGNNPMRSKENSIKAIENQKITIFKIHGVHHLSHVPEFMTKATETKITRGLATSFEFKTLLENYKISCKNLTNRIKIELFKNWDGLDFYDKEYIKDNLLLKWYDANYPTIDHIVSLFEGFKNSIPPEEICKTENLCITKRWINSYKNNKNVEDFKITFSKL